MWANDVTAGVQPSVAITFYLYAKCASRDVSDLERFQFRRNHTNERALRLKSSTGSVKVGIALILISRCSMARNSKSRASATSSIDQRLRPTPILFCSARWRLRYMGVASATFCHLNRSEALVGPDQG